MAVIEVKNLTKEYQLGALTNIKGSALNLLKRIQGKPVEERERFKALDDISFSIEKGEVVGIIGTNGAGKSTLLKHLAKITTPTSGSVSVSGTVAPLIEVGAGFVPDLTGRENIYLNCSIMGLSRKETKAKIDEIIEFSELEEFIDTPIKRYSSGMSVRLGFAVATSIDADILIVDEVLAVGDLAFQRKCFKRMENLIKYQGRTVLMVSHNIRQVERICSRVILMDHGKILVDNTPSVACEMFYERSNRKVASQLAASQSDDRHVRKTGEIELESITLITEHGDETDELQMGGKAILRAIFHSECHFEKPEVIFGFHSTDFVYIASMGNAHIVERPDMHPGRNIVECHIKHLPLMPGVYCVRLGVLDNTSREVFYGEMLKTFAVKTRDQAIAHMPVLGFIHIDTQWSFPEPQPHSQS